MSQTRKEDIEESIPLVAQVWRRVYRAVPKWNLPLTNLNVSFVLFSAAFLCSIRLLSEHMLVILFGWPEGDLATQEAAGSVGSICHGARLCVGLIVAFQTQAYSLSARFDEAPGWW
jgi:hypothetical protein